ncbi:MAG: PP2C family protein-serine/threonine phosphatase, partial [Acidobacteriaceae bacterium]
MGSSLTSPGLFPVSWPHLDGADLHARYYSECRGGDFFDGLTVGERVLFLLTDVAGAGPNVREVTQKAQSVFRQTAQELFERSEVNESDAVAELTHAVNLALIEAAGGVRFAPTFLGCFNQTLGILTYCNGGNLLALFREGDKVRALESSGMPLGLFTHTTFESVILALQNGDALLLATKGVSESKRGKEEFGVERVMQLLADSPSLSASELCEILLQQAHDFADVSWWRLRRGRQAVPQDLTALA